MSSRVEQLDDMAWECRALANATVHVEVREQLLEIADHFERLALYRRLSQIRTLVRSHASSSPVASPRRLVCHVARRGGFVRS